jgi:2'-5' RNA ligase
MQYLVVTFPNIKPFDFERIERYRRKYDNQFFKIIKPHFTLFFPAIVNESTFIDEISSRSKGLTKVQFVIEKAVIHKDELSENIFIYLIPGRGFGEIIFMHERMYSGSLTAHLKTEIEYVPHITLARTKTVDEANEISQGWNTTSSQIEGVIEQISILRYSNDQIEVVKKIELENIH